MNNEKIDSKIVVENFIQNLYSDIAEKY